MHKAGELGNEARFPKARFPKVITTVQLMYIAS